MSRVFMAKQNLSGIRFIKMAGESAASKNHSSSFPVYIATGIVIATLAVIGFYALKHVEAKSKDDGNRKTSAQQQHSKNHDDISPMVLPMPAKPNILQIPSPNIYPNSASYADKHKNDKDIQPSNSAAR